TPPPRGGAGLLLRARELRRRTRRTRREDVRGTGPASRRDPKRTARSPGRTLRRHRNHRGTQPRRGRTTPLRTRREGAATGTVTSHRTAAVPHGLRDRPDGVRRPDHRTGRVVGVHGPTGTLVGAGGPGELLRGRADPALQGVPQRGRTVPLRHRVAVRALRCRIRDGVPPPVHVATAQDARYSVLVRPGRPRGQHVEAPIGGRVPLLPRGRRL